MTPMSYISTSKEFSVLRRMILNLLMALLISLLGMGYALPADASEDMCESIQKHIKIARKVGGIVKSREKVAQILESHKYLKKNISQSDLVLCVLLSGEDPSYVKNVASSVGIPVNIIEAAIFRAQPSAPVVMDIETVSLDSVPPYVEPAKAMPSVELDEICEAEIDYVPILEQDLMGLDMGSDDDECGVRQISPWTWCAN